MEYSRAFPKEGKKRQMSKIVFVMSKNLTLASLKTETIFYQFRVKINISFGYLYRTATKYDDER